MALWYVVGRMKNAYPSIAAFAHYSVMSSHVFICFFFRPVQFDPATQRYQAMRISHYEHFKPTGLSLRTGLFVVVLPIVLYTWWMKSDRDRRELRFRSGEVAYKDRQFKFI